MVNIGFRHILIQRWLPLVVVMFIYAGCANGQNSVAEKETAVKQGSSSVDQDSPAVKQWDFTENNQMVFKVSLGTYYLKASDSLLQVWDSVLGPDLEVYEDSGSVRTYMTGSYGSAQRAEREVVRLKEAGIPNAKAELCGPGNVILRDWGGRLPYGDRIR